MEQKIRATLFYTSVISFFILLPLILLYSFGYKLDVSRFRFTRTGLIYIKTLPEGAKVYLNDRYLKKTTPVSIEELMPGEYKISLEFVSYYPWQQKITVKPGETTYLDNIILFPKKPHLDKINILDIGNFYIFSLDKEYAYCVSEDRTAIYKARLNPKEQEVILLCDQLNLPANIKDIALSPDKKKIFYFNENRLDIIYLPTEKIDYEQAKNNNFFILADSRILHAFWYSDNERIIVITDKDIKIYELLGQGKNNTITVLNLRDNHTRATYNSEEDILYFTDMQKGADGKWHRGLYRMDMGRKTPFTFIRGIEENLK
jgi:hypothetical protein